MAFPRHLDLSEGHLAWLRSHTISSLSLTWDTPGWHSFAVGQLAQAQRALMSLAIHEPVGLPLLPRLRHLHLHSSCGQPLLGIRYLTKALSRLEGLHLHGYSLVVGLSQLMPGLLELQWAASDSGDLAPILPPFLAVERLTLSAPNRLTLRWAAVCTLRARHITVQAHSLHLVLPPSPTSGT